MRQIFISILTGVVLLTGTAQTKRAINTNDLLGFGRVSDQQVSPDGKTVAFVVTSQLIEENKSVSNIYLVPASGSPVSHCCSGKSEPGPCDTARTAGR